MTRVFIIILLITYRESRIFSANLQQSISFSIFLQILGIWTLDGRDHHNYAWRLRYKRATLFVVGYPMSPYTRFMPRKSRYLIPTKHSKNDLEIAKVVDMYSTSKILTHLNNFNMPDLYAKNTSSTNFSISKHLETVWRFWILMLLFLKICIHIWY